MNTNIFQSQSQSRLNKYCKLIALLTFIPIITILIGMVSPLLFYFFDIHNIGLESGGYSFFIAHSADSSDIDPTKLSTWQAVLVTLIDTIIIAILVYAFFQLRLLFLSYSKSDYFSVSSANYCYKFGTALVIWEVIQLITGPLSSLILSFNNDPSERYISLSFTSEDLMLLFPSISIMIVGQILKKACQIAEENKQFI